jgi:hypothetical protein
MHLDDFIEILMILIDKENNLDRQLVSINKP